MNCMLMSNSKLQASLPLFIAEVSDHDKVQEKHKKRKAKNKPGAILALLFLKAIGSVFVLY